MEKNGLFSTLYGRMAMFLRLSITSGFEDLDKILPKDLIGKKIGIYLDCEKEGRHIIVDTIGGIRYRADSNTIFLITNNPVKIGDCEIFGFTHHEGSWYAIPVDGTEYSDLIKGELQIL